MSEVNPYASPATAASPLLERRGRLVVRFTVDGEEVLLRSMRQSFLSEGAESMGCIVFSVIFVVAIVLAFLLGRFGLVPTGYIVGAIIGLIAAEYYRRLFSRRCLARMQKKMGIMPGARCQLELTRTKLLLKVDEKHYAWPLHELLIFRWRKFERKPPFLLMSIIAKGELVLPVSAFADFGDSTPEEFHREFRRRAAACVTRRNRRLWRSIFGWPRRRVAAD